MDKYKPLYDFIEDSKQNDFRRKISGKRVQAQFENLGGVTDDLLKLDGSRTMAGDLDMNDYHIKNFDLGNASYFPVGNYAYKFPKIVEKRLDWSKSPSNPVFYTLKEGEFILMFAGGGASCYPDDNENLGKMVTIQGKNEAGQIGYVHKNCVIRMCIGSSLVNAYRSDFSRSFAVQVNFYGAGFNDAILRPKVTRGDNSPVYDFDGKTNVFHPVRFLNPSWSYATMETFKNWNPSIIGQNMYPMTDTHFLYKDFIT